ncbi:MAG TPA: ABC transporter permease subunit [Pyrinomonadaceae bacterium]|nr:ABC transporter permease subunit [Pyrinomonadaceae bacterium]
MRTFAAIIYNEVLLNSKRVAPYVIAVLCAGNALLWWARGPATGQGWATNADFFIAGVLPAFSFLFVPLYTVVMMADPVIRDFRIQVDPLIFSKPVTRAQYLLGKFFGSFLVLAGCQSAFVITLFFLQWVPKRGMVVQEAKFLLYPKHFLVFVVISHLVLAAIYFTAGTLTRSSRIVYGLGIAFYPLYISYQEVLLKSLPIRWRVVLDPLLMNWGNPWGYKQSAEVLNRLVIVYDANLIINRAGMILLAAICLTILYLRFTISERSARAAGLSVLNLSTAAESVHYPESSATPFEPIIASPAARASAGRRVPGLIPGPAAGSNDLTIANEGTRAEMNKLIAALGVEFQLLAAERSLVAVMPVAVLISILEVALYKIPADISHSAAYATNTAKLLLPFLIGIAVFYTGETMHRDREVRIEPVLWTTPVSNKVLLSSKFLATLLLLTGLMVVVGFAGVIVQLLRGHTPIDLSAYLRVYGIVLLPGAMFVAALSLLLNVILRNKYLVYVVSIGSAAGLFYLYHSGYNHWTINPLLYRLWTYADLTSWPALQTILWYRSCGILAAICCLSIAYLLFPRRSGR